MSGCISQSDLAGKREYNMEAKMSITTKPPHRQA